MIVACSTLCFGRYSLEDALRTIRQLHFSKADLAIHADGPHLRPADLPPEVGKWAQKLKAANLGYAAFHMEFDQPDGPAVREQLRAACRLARLLAVPVLTVPAADAGADAEAEAKRLTDWVKLAEADGIILTVETRSGTLTQDAACAVDLCRKVPGLGLTLDPSHYHCGPHRSAGYDAVYPFVRHVRLRDSGADPTQFQVRVGQGEIEYGKILGHLDRCQYDRSLTVDVRDIPDSAFPVEPEVRKLKFLLESLV